MPGRTPSRHSCLVCSESGLPACLPACFPVLSAETAISPESAKSTRRCVLLCIVYARTFKGITAGVQQMFHVDGLFYENIDKYPSFSSCSGIKETTTQSLR